MKNLVLGEYSYPNPELRTKKGGIEFFLKTLRKYNKECTIIIFCKNGYESEEFNELVSNYNAYFLKHDVIYKHFDDRFIHFYLFLKDNFFDNVLLCDMDDVIFQDDPFKIEFGDKLYITCESCKLTGKVPPPGSPYAGNANWPESININWLASAYGAIKKENRHYSAYRQEVIDKFKDNYILNTGTILGSHKEIMNYLTFYQTINNFTEPGRVIGQGIYNYYCYNISKNHIIKTNKESSIITCCHIDGHSYLGNDVPTLKRDSENFLINDNGERYKIIHMYNRLNQAFKGEGMRIVSTILTNSELNEAKNTNNDIKSIPMHIENNITLNINEYKPKKFTYDIIYSKDFNTFDKDIRKRLISFGNERFKKSRERIINEANKLEIFDECICEKENILEEDEFKKIIDKLSINGTGRGYYWYMWKPYIIYKHLQNLNEGDILFYCDSGMTIPNTKTTKFKFINLFNLVSDVSLCPTGIATFITTGHEKDRIEKQFTLLQTFKCLGVENNEDIINSQQCQAGVTMIYKCKQSVEIIEKWYNFTVTNPEIFIGDYRFCKLERMNQCKDFKDHRHDQSVWSILCKLYGVTILTHDKNPIYQSHCRE